VIAFFSRALTRAEVNYCTTRKEMLAVVLSLRKFHSYLYGQEILLRTDNSAVSWAKTLKNPSGQNARWLQELEAYNMTIMHRPGTAHRNADALSRIPCASCARAEKAEQLWQAENKQDVPSVLHISLLKELEGYQSIHAELSLKNEENQPAVCAASRQKVNANTEQPSTSHEADRLEREQQSTSTETSSTKVFFASTPQVMLEGWDNEKLREKQMADENIGYLFRSLEHSALRPKWSDISEKNCYL
jgi:hypothetical protein